jgi:hypothetical protein
MTAQSIAGRRGEHLNVVGASGMAGTHQASCPSTLLSSRSLPFAAPSHSYSFQFAVAPDNPCLAD